MTVTQCGDTDLHPAHDECAGLDGTEVAQAHDPLTVACPDCLARPGSPCLLRGALGDRDEADTTPTVHPGRYDQARAAAVRFGTCALCGNQLLQLTDPDDTWHPHSVIPPGGCPPEPSASDDWPAYAAWANAGNRTGRPGAEHFIPGPPPCPECLADKCRNCTGQTLDPVTDDLVPCPCPH